MKSAEVIRDALRALPAYAATSTGSAPSVEEMYFPESHVEALDPDVSLVIGNRGMGKTFWSFALFDLSLRAEISQRFRAGARGWDFRNMDVGFGFSDAEGSNGAVSKADLRSATRKKVSSEAVWRAVVVRAITSLRATGSAGFPQDLSFWLTKSNQELTASLRNFDTELGSEGRRVLLVFDQLDQIADEWSKIQELTQGLLKIALALKSYRNIKIKIFMRPDQAENRELFRFPDASKILGGARRLTWKATDLYGLLIFHLYSDDSSRKAIRFYCRKAGIDPSKLHARLRIPVELVSAPALQGELFDLIAGEMMGGGTKRGRPYSWIPTHLADARGEISPRTFLKVMRVAAVENDSGNPRTAIDYSGIIEGVRKASSDRLAELEEDYPWISTALSPLRGMHVPTAPKDVFEKWDEANTVSLIASKFSGKSAPIDLVVADLVEVEQSLTLARLLQEIGVLEQRANGKFNVPDIFRVNAGILRKGGVAPQLVRQ